jgi:hypothetical protein
MTSARSYSSAFLPNDVRNIVFFTGAEISAESGIATFRGPGREAPGREKVAFPNGGRK